MKSRRVTAEKDIRIAAFEQQAKQDKLLVRLYLACNPSKHEWRVTEIVEDRLTELGVNFSVDSYGQIYRFIKNTPLLAAHMDSVIYHPVKNVIFERGTGIYKGEDGTIGGDDKNGVYILLKLIEKYKNKFSFIFSCNEESGGYIGELLKDKSTEVSQCTYGMIPDRRGCFDLIAEKNDYCTPVFETELLKHVGPLGFASESGSFSDCNKMKEYMSCANFSCGYFNPHSVDDYSLFHSINNTFKAMETCVLNIKGKFEKPAKPELVVTKYQSTYMQSDFPSTRVLGREKAMLPKFTVDSIKMDYCFNCQKPLLATEHYATEEFRYGSQSTTLRCKLCSGFVTDYYYCIPEDRTEIENKKLFKRITVPKKLILSGEFITKMHLTWAIGFGMNQAKPRYVDYDKINKFIGRDNRAKERIVMHSKSEFCLMLIANIECDNNIFEWRVICRHGKRNLDTRFANYEDAGDIFFQIRSEFFEHTYPLEENFKLNHA